MIRMNTITAPAINLAIKRGGMAWRISRAVSYDPRRFWQWKNKGQIGTN